MGQPVFIPGSAGVKVKYGGLPQPNGQGVMPWVDLNDRAIWQCDGVAMPVPSSSVVGAGYLYKGRGAWTAEDFAGRTAIILSRYREGGGRPPLGAALPQLYLAGEQYLSFDDGMTGMPAKLANVSNRHALTSFYPFLWGMELEFRAVDPWFRDLMATAGSQNIAAATDVPVTWNLGYPGSVWAEPIWTFTIPNSGETYRKLKFANTMSGETLTVNAPAYGAGVHKIVIDCAKQYVYFDQPSQQLDPIGSFPMLYGPQGTVNQMALTMTYTGAIGGVPTMAWSFNTRWDL